MKPKLQTKELDHNLKNYGDRKWRIARLRHPAG